MLLSPFPPSSPDRGKATATHSSIVSRCHWHMSLAFCASETCSDKGKTCGHDNPRSGNRVRVRVRNRCRDRVGVRIRAIWVGASVPWYLWCRSGTYTAGTYTRGCAVGAVHDNRGAPPLAQRQQQPARHPRWAWSKTLPGANVWTVPILDSLWIDTVVAPAAAAL